MLTLFRQHTGLQPYTRYPILGSPTIRGYLKLGPVTISAGITIPNKAHTATNTHLAFFEGYFVRVNGELPAIWQGSSVESKKYGD